MSCPRVLLCIVFGIALYPRTVCAYGVTLNEMLPDPAGSDDAEWIELYNGGEEAVQISGWRIDDSPDGGSAQYLIASGSAIAAHGFFVLEKSISGITLNNDGDMVRITAPDGGIIDEHAYSETESGVSIGRMIDGEGAWGLCNGDTKGEPNDCVFPTTPPSLTPTNTPKPVIIHSPTPIPTPLQTPTQYETPTSYPTPRREQSVFAILVHEGTVSGIATDTRRVATGGANPAPGTTVHSRALVYPLLSIGVGLGLLSFALSVQKTDIWKNIRNASSSTGHPS